MHSIRYKEEPSNREINYYLFVHSGFEPPQQSDFKAKELTDLTRSKENTMLCLKKSVFY